MYEIFVNGRPIDSNPCVTVLDEFVERHDFMTCLPRIETIDISLLNKETNDTKLNSEGQIVEDLLLVIEKISIGNIDLTNKIDKISVFRGDQGEIYRTFNYITFNGVYRIKIHRNPLYTEWLASYR